VPFRCREVTPGFAETIVADYCASAFDLDAQGHAHFLVIHGSDSGGTATGHYVTNASGSFVSTPVDEEAGRIRSVSLAVDAAGVVHVAYDKITGSTVRYASNTGGTWRAQRVAGAPLGGAGSQMALDANGVPNIAMKGSEADLFIGVPAADAGTDSGGDGWLFTRVSDLGARAIDLFFEADGSRHIVFGPDSTNLAVASAGASWTVTNVATASSGSLARPGGPGSPLRLTFRVPESSATPVQLRHAIETNAGVWGASTLVDEAPRWDLTRPQSVVTRDGHLHVVYSMVDSIGGGCGLHVATLAPGAAEFTVRRVARYGQGPLAALDQNDKLHLAYCSSGKLVYLVEP
jgi:hypothetical protein